MARKPKTSSVIVIDRTLIVSQAYMRLSGIAPQVLLMFLARRRVGTLGRKGKEKKVILNNGQIVFSYSEALKRFGITPPRFARALSQLIKFGFIDINHVGGGMVKDISTYYISDRWENYGTQEFEEKKRPKDTRGLGFTKKNWEEKTGKKRKASSKISNNNVTRTSNNNVTAYRGITHASSNKNVTEEIDPNFFIYKGEEVFQYFQLRSNKNVTIL